MISKTTFIAIGILFILLGCNSTQGSNSVSPEESEQPKEVISTPIEEPLSETPEVMEEEFTALKFNVAIGISAQRPRWVLFKNGTYIIFPEGHTDAQIQEKAIQIIRSYTNDPIAIKKSNFAKGWIGSTSTGIYTYISRDQLGEGIPKNSDIQAQARQNIVADKAAPKVVHINSKKQ